MKLETAYKNTDIIERFYYDNINKLKVTWNIKNSTKSITFDGYEKTRCARIYLWSFIYLI